MTNRQILNKAIQKAIKGGYSDLVTEGVEVLGVDEFGEYLKLKGKFQGYYDVAIYQLIYNHDFAKALWPKEEGVAGNWIYHLRHMVVAEDPVKYLGKNI